MGLKILFISSYYPPDIGGGAELSLQVIVEGMQRKGCQVSVLATGDCNGLIVHYVNGVRVYRAGLKNIYWPLSQNRPAKIKRLQWHIKDIYNTEMNAYVQQVLIKEQPDLVSCHNLSGWSISIWKILRNYDRPVLQVLHDLYLLCPNGNMFKKEESCPRQCALCISMRMRHKKASGRINGVVGISGYILEKFIAAGYFKRAEKKVIYNARQIEDSPMDNFRKPGSPLRVGYIGSLVPAKGFEWLLNTFLGLEDADMTLLVAGRGQLEYEQKLKTMARKDGRVKFIGFVPSQVFYKNIDVLVVPSLWEEPLGMVAVEACARNIPVITTGRGGLKEIIKDKVNGLLIEAGSSEDLRNALIWLKADIDLYNNLKASARYSVRLFLEQDRLINEYSTVYYKLMMSSSMKTPAGTI